MTFLLTTAETDIVVSVEDNATLISGVYFSQIRPAPQEIQLEAISCSNEYQIHSVGLTQLESAEIRNQLRSFEELWDAPGMEDYDDL